MAGAQRLIGPGQNLAAAATITASSVASASNTVMQLPTVRDGSAAASITGSYTGADDAVYDVQIVDTTVSTPLTTDPVFAGVGNGTLTGASYSGTAQSFTVELADLGAVLTAAGTDFEGVTLRARVPGSGGNSLRVHIDRAPGVSPLTFTPTTYSLLNDLAAGSGSDDNPLTGAEFDWGTVVMGTDKLIPTGALRIAFGEDRNNIYRQFKRYESGQWRYYFEPAIAVAVPRGTVVQTVTGGRTVTITDGSTTETYTGIVTLWDLLGAIKTTSTLVEVVGVVAADRSRGGMAARELVTRTDAHALLSSGSGSAYATGFSGVSVGSGAATELVEARCYAVTAKDAQGAVVGGEFWELRGSVSGLLAAKVISGATFTSSNLTLTIPRKVPDGFGVTRGRFSVDSIEYAQRDQGVEPPPICVVATTLGPAAVDMAVQLVYTKRPSGACACDDLPVPDLNTPCLNGQEDDNVSNYSAGNLTRLQALYDWQADTVRANSSYITDTAEQFVREGRTANLQSIVALFHQTLDQLNGMPLGSERTAGESAWDTAFTEVQADVDRFLGDAKPFAAVAGEALTAGNFVSISEQIVAAPPSTSVTLTAYTTVPNSSWVAIRKVQTNNSFPPPPIPTYALFCMPLSTISGAYQGVGYVGTGGSANDQLAVQAAGTVASQAITVYDSAIGNPMNGTWSRAIAAGEVVGLGPDGAAYVFYNAGTSPTGTTLIAATGAVASDGTPNPTIDLAFPAQPNVPMPSTLTYTQIQAKKLRPGEACAGFVLASVSSNAAVTVYPSGNNSGLSALSNQAYYLSATSAGGVTASSAAALPSTDIQLTYVNSTTLAVARESASADKTAAALIAERYKSRLQWVLAMAGESPLGKGSASSAASVDGCWHDMTDEPYYWSVIAGNGGAYMPAFNNTPYYSAVANPDGTIQGTHEFAFQVNVKCPEGLKEGDTIKLLIGDSAWPSTYQVGDVLTLPVIAASDLYLTGGTDGDNIQTWYVSGSLHGPFPPHSLDLDSPAGYSNSGLAFTINPGAIAFAKGDRFTFSVEGGHWKWRKNAGSWSTSAAISGSPAVLDSGLSVTFAPGAAPAFSAGDTYSFKALQPNSPSNTKVPTWQAWRYNGSSATLTLDFGSAKSFDFVGIAFHSLPAGAAVAVHGSADNSAWTSLGSLDLTSSAVAGLLLGSPASWRYVRLSLSSAAAGAVGWVVVGAAFAPSLSAEWAPKRSYRLDRADAGLVGAAAYLGRSISGTLSWSEGALSETDVTSLAAVVDGAKSADDAPIILYPQATRITEPVLATVADDEIEIPDVWDYQPAAGNARRYSARIALRGVAV